EQIIEGYRLFFDRDPESEATIDSYITLDWELWQFLRILADSAEGRRCQVDKGSQLFIAQPNCAIEAEATPEVVAELMASTKSAWSDFGETDAFWSVLTEEKFRTAAFDDATRTAFYGSGEAEFADFTAACRRNGIVIDRGAT